MNVEITNNRNGEKRRCFLTEADIGILAKHFHVSMAKVAYLLDQGKRLSMRLYSYQRVEGPRWRHAAELYDEDDWKTVFRQRRKATTKENRDV